MRKLEVIQTGYDSEREFLKSNMSNINECVASFKPKHKGLFQVIMKSGEIREYHGQLAQ